MDQLRRPLRPGPPSPPRRGGALQGAAACVALTLAAAVVGACVTSPPPQDAWHNSFASPAALASAVLGSLAGRDTASLATYALTQHELRTTVWPSLPASRPEVGMPWDYFWREHAQRNAGNIQTLVNEYGGRRYELIAVSFAGRDLYGDVVVHRDSSLDLKTPEGARRIRLFGSMVERHGRWKLYSYVAD